jgi:hypothetical protein
VLHRKPRTSPAYWQGWGGLRARLGCQFHTVLAAVSEAMAHTPRSSALVENLTDLPRVRVRKSAGKLLNILD